MKDRKFDDAWLNLITPDMVDWDAYKRSVEESIANERLWGLGGSVRAEENIERLRAELDLIKNEEYAEVFSMYDAELWGDYLK